MIDHPQVEPYIDRAALAHMRHVGLGYMAFAVFAVILTRARRQAEQLA